MKWMEKQTDLGVLKYRMPNMLEVYDILEASREGNGTVNNIALKKNVLKSISPLIDFSGIEGIQKYEDLFEHVDTMLVPLSEISDEIIVKTFGAFKKKSS